MTHSFSSGLRQTTSLSTFLYTGFSKIEAIDTTLATREEVFVFLRDNLLKAHQQMKEQANTHRKPMNFRLMIGYFSIYSLFDNNQWPNGRMRIYP